MYLHLGNSVVVPFVDIVGVFDLDNTTADSRITRDFLKRAEQGGRVISVGDDLPKSFVVSTDKIYLSQLSAATLNKRSELKFMEV